MAEDSKSGESRGQIGGFCKSVNNLYTSARGAMWSWEAAFKAKGVQMGVNVVEASIGDQEELR